MTHTILARFLKERPLLHSRIFRCLAGVCLVMCIAIAGMCFLVPSPVTDAESWPVSPALLDKKGRLFHVRLSSREEYCIPVPLERMGKWLPLVAVSVEDKRFYYHLGMDPLAMGRAIAQNIANRSVVSGASTITSQVVRLTYPRDRTITTKAMEFAQAIKLDFSLSKRRILEIYLNRAPFGGPVRGVEAAARSYFGKRAEELSLAEAALLIGMLRGPSFYRPDKNPKRTLERRNAILHRLAERNIVPQPLLQLALLEPLPPGRSAIPSEARHFADFVLHSLPLGHWENGALPVKTTLDPALQNLLELGLTEGLAPFPAQITAAGGITETATGALVAYVGNQRFDLHAKKHWVDCGIAKRSPGSILKPFVYLQAMDQGKLIPASLLADTPLSFAGEAPRNYDRNYRGPVSASFALANSLNAPAVRVLRLAGGESTLQFLRRLGFSFLSQTAGHYGDSLALGGCEVSLMQVLKAYTTLATFGVQRPISAIAETAQPGRLGEQRVFPSGSGYLIADILREGGRMPPLLRQRLTEQGRSIAFKTGTSYGLRDAWAAAYTPTHAIAVWLGDPEGMPHPMLTGLPVAAPIALRVLSDILPQQGTQRWFTPPPDVERFVACTLSGMPANPACPTQHMAWRIRDVTRTTPCTVHSVRSGQLKATLPADLQDFVHHKNTKFQAKERIDITSPMPNTRYFITPEAAEQKIALNSEGGQGKLYWFINQEFFGVQKNGESLLWPLVPGKYHISLVDEDGRTGSATCSVIDIMEKKAPLLQLRP